MRRPRLVAALVAAVVSALAVVVRVAASGRSDLDTADRARAAGLGETAATFYGRAARWYLPGMSVQSEALAALLDMAREAEAAGDAGFALRCLREAREAVLSTRWLVTSAPDTLDEANAGIARLMAAEDRAMRGDRALTEAGHLALLRKDHAPDPWLSLLALVLFVAWVGALVRGGLVGVMPDGTVRWRVLGLHAAASIALLVAWLCVVRLA